MLKDRILKIIGIHHGFHGVTDEKALADKIIAEIPEITPDAFIETPEELEQAVFEVIGKVVHTMQNDDIREAIESAMERRKV